MLLVIDYGLSNLKYSLWENDNLLKMSIKERIDKTNFALEKSIEKTYNEYVEFACEYLELPNKTKDVFEKILVIASKHPEQTKSKTFVIDFVKEDMTADIKTTIKDRVATDALQSLSQEQNMVSQTNTKKSKKNENKANVFNYTEQLIDNEFNYIQNILGVACNTDYLYKLTVALHGAGITNYMILDPSQVMSRLTDTTESTLILDIGYNSYYCIVTSETLENGVVVKNIIKNNDAVKVGSKLIDDALLNKGYTQEEIWNEKINNTYSDLESTLNISYMDIVDNVMKDIVSFTESNRKEVSNILIIGGASNQLNLKEYILNNIKGIRVPKNDNRVNTNENYKLKYTEPYLNSAFSKLPSDIKSYFYNSFAAYNLYIEKTHQRNPDNELMNGKIINLLDTESKFLNSFKIVKTFKKTSKYTVIASSLLFALCIGIVAQWHLYKNLSSIYSDKASAISSEKQALTSQINQIDSEIQTIEQDLLAETYDWSKVLNAIGLATPKGVQITSITTGSEGDSDTDTVMIVGYSDSRFKISDMSTLLKDSIFTEAEIQDIVSLETVTRKSIQKFTIKCVGKR